MKRQARLFAITEYLRARRTGVTAEVLAQKFDVTVRTIYRDLDELRDAALPLTAEQGRGGGYALEKHYSLPPVNFTAREAAMLLTVTGYATRLRVVPFVETLESGAEKVRAALSTSAQRELLSLLDKLEFTGVPATATRPQVRQAVEDALVGDLPLRVRFRRADTSISERTVRVERLLLERSRTLLNVVDVETGVKRQYPMDQIERAELAR
jgi:predicted DNA-binding transcriptional regulator YafY